MNDEYSILMDIEREIKPIMDFLEVRYVDNNLTNIGLKKEISFKEFNLYFPDIKKKELIKLLGWFNDNLKATEEVIKHLKINRSEV